MDLKEIGRQLAQIGLPLLGAALPIPGGAVLGSALARVLGPDAEGKVPTRADDLLARLTQDAEAMQRAKQFEAEHAERMMTLKLDHERRVFEAEAGDRDSARKASVDGGTSGRLFWLSVVLLIFTLGAEAFVLFNGLPAGVSEIVVGRVLGLFDAITTTVLAFWFGSSLGSFLKNPRQAA